MSLALRPYMNAGVALVGAGVIALTPVAAPSAAVHAPALPSAATIELTAFTNPLETWASVATATFANLGGLGQAIADNPLPILRQLIANQVANTTKLAGIAQTVGTNIVSMLDPRNSFGSASLLQKAVTQAAAGDVAGAIDSVYQALIVVPAFRIGFPLLGAYDIVNTTAKHMQQFVAVVPNLFIGAGMTFLFGTLGGLSYALQDTAQGFLDAVKAGHIETAASIALNAPAVLTGAVLNGYAPFGTSGLLGEDGPIRTVVHWLETAAEAIGKPAPTSTVAAKSAPEPEPTQAIAVTPAPDSAASSSAAASPISPSTKSPISTATATKADSITKQTNSTKPEPTATTDDSVATESAATQPEREAAGPAPKARPVPTPGQAVDAMEKAAAKAISTAGKQITSTTNKIGEDLKKTFTKPRKSAKTDTSTKPTKSDSDGSGSNEGHKASSGATK